MSLISDNAKNQINQWIEKYPENHKNSAVMEALRIIQAENKNTLNPELIGAVADLLNMPKIAVMEVATFYENYNLDISKHRYQIRICHNISCMLKGGDNLINYLEKKLEIKNNQVSAGGGFYLKKVECLGACVGAPMMQIGDSYYENLDEDKIDEILDSL